MSRRDDRRAEKAREWEERERAEADEWQRRKSDLFVVPDHLKDFYLEIEDASTPALAKAIYDLLMAMEEAA